MGVQGISPGGFRTFDIKSALVLFSFQKKVCNTFQSKKSELDQTGLNYFNFFAVRQKRIKPSSFL
jgi:hypothetical protein